LWSCFQKHPTEGSYQAAVSYLQLIQPALWYFLYLIVWYVQLLGALWQLRDLLQSFFRTHNSGQVVETPAGGWAEVRGPHQEAEGGQSQNCLHGRLQWNTRVKYPSSMKLFPSTKTNTFYSQYAIKVILLEDVYFLIIILVFAIFPFLEFTFEDNGYLWNIYYSFCSIKSYTFSLCSNIVMLNNSTFN